MHSFMIHRCNSCVCHTAGSSCGPVTGACIFSLDKGPVHHFFIPCIKMFGLQQSCLSLCRAIQHSDTHVVFTVLDFHTSVHEFWRLSCRADTVSSPRSQNSPQRRTTTTTTTTGASGAGGLQSIHHLPIIHQTLCLLCPSMSLHSSNSPNQKKTSGP